MANTMELMLARLQHMRAHPPTAEVFKPELKAAGNRGARVAAVHRTPAKVTVRTTQGRAELSFSGPGAARAKAEAEEQLRRTLPAAVERARLDIARKLRR